MSVGDYSWDCGVYWGKLGVVSASCKQGAYSLVEIIGALMSVRDICSRLRVGGTNHGARSVSTAAVSKNRSWHQRLLMIFGLIPTSVKGVWSGPVSVKDI